MKDLRKGFEKALAAVDVKSKQDLQLEKEKVQLEIQEVELEKHKIELETARMQRKREKIRLELERLKGAREPEY